MKTIMTEAVMEERYMNELSSLNSAISLQICCSFRKATIVALPTVSPSPQHFSFDEDSEDISQETFIHAYPTRYLISQATQSHPLTQNASREARFLRPRPCLRSERSTQSSQGRQSCQIKGHQPNA